MDVSASGDRTELLSEGLGEHYRGGRAQAESGSKIIENDYQAWKAVCSRPYRLPAEHHLVQQFSRAWVAVSTQGLGDDAGAASIRYRVLAHAARALVPAGRGGEGDALVRLGKHAYIHGCRLYATGLERFAGSAAGGRYAGFAQAAAASAVVDRRYRAWRESSGRWSAAGDSGLAAGVVVLGEAWADIEQHGLMDGHGAAAGRYRALADHARALTGDVARGAPTAAVTPILELAMYADKHSIRLHNTAVAIHGTDGDTAYRGLPAQVATTAAQAHSDAAHVGPVSTQTGDGYAAQIMRKTISLHERGR
jgi:hypothetical protein